MDIIKEINKLPNYFYSFESNGKLHCVILGGHSCMKSSKIELVERLLGLLDTIEKTYEKDNLSDEDKILIAQTMKKIQTFCDYRLENLYTIKQQEDYLNSLPKDALDQISKQVEMYQNARILYRDFVYGK